MKLRLGVTAAVLATTALTATTLPVTPARAGAPPSSPVALTGPATVTVTTYDGALYGDLGINLLARERAFEVRTQRPTWTSPITAYWQSPTGPKALPAQTRWDALDDFVLFAIKRRSDGKVLRTRHLDVCLNQWNTQRTRPDAPLRSRYPAGCPYNPFTIGSVQGVEEGWVTNVEAGDESLRLPPGTYDMVARISRPYVDALGIDAADAVRRYQLVVRKETDGEVVKRSTLPDQGARAATEGDGDVVTPLEPGAKPRRARAGAPTDAVPDLRALPAFGMRLSGDGRYLRFSANVWNAGNGPMVVDGFRRGTTDVMDAYQVFVDSDGNQTGYQQVGTMIWHTAPSHNHWHFKDFARYTLLRADRTEVVVSRKESFCLANTDAIDYTVEGADWKPENTDLHTSCGDRGSISLREVLSAGSGDTYDQFRAGQAFRVDNLPNGDYYIAVEANPNRNLVESNTSNNRALRKIRLSGTPTDRRVTFYKVGLVDDRGYGGEEEGH